MIDEDGNQLVQVAAENRDAVGSAYFNSTREGGEHTMQAVLPSRVKQLVWLSRRGEHLLLMGHVQVVYQW